MESGDLPSFSFVGSSSLLFPFFDEDSWTDLLKNQKEQEEVKREQRGTRERQEETEERDREASTGGEEVPSL